MQNCLPPMMEDVLSQFVTGLWPNTIEKKFEPGDKWYPTLRATSKAQGIRPKSKEAFFRIILNFDFIGFENVGGLWKIVYKIRDRVHCEMCDGETVTLVGGISRNDLVFMAETPAERLINTYRLEEKDDVWRFAKPG